MPSTNRKTSILVVDDEIDVCHNLSDILTAFGYEVDVATSGHAALELARARPYDIALLDLRMPGMDGLTLYRELKTIRAGTAAMIVTAYVSSDTAREALEAGACRIVPKPVDVPFLMSEVERTAAQPTVLVVDDDRDLCENLKDLLHRQNYRVCIAHSEEAAARMAQGSEYRVVLLDLKLPGGDSTRLLKTIRRSNPQARTILITGHRNEMEELIERVLGEGANAVCYKPFDIDHLLAAIRQFAASAGQS